MSISLKKFLLPVPVCEPTASLASVWETLSQSQSDRLVVVDPQHHPLGVIRLKPLLAYLYSVSTSDRPLLRNQPIDGLNPTIVEPLSILSLQNNQIPTTTTQDWAVVDTTGTFLGLLDLQKWSNRGLETPETTEQQLTLNLLVELLEHLPLPLKLQTSSGQVLTQNRVWQTQVEEAKELIPHWDDPHCTTNRVQEVTSEGYSTLAIQRLTPLTSQTTYPSSDQKRVWQFTQLPLLPLSSDPTCRLVLVLATDITDQRLVAEELAVKNADLVHLNRLKDEFLACISHELKTPLTAVLGLSSLLKDQALGELNERQSRYAKLIHQSGRQLMSVVNDILDLTRMETGQIELTLEPMQIRAVCDRAYQQAQQHQDEPTERKFILSIDPELNLLVADEMRLRQMLTHLLSNALKFTDPGGEIGLKVALWEGWVAFTVWDTGIGIPAQKQHLIFQKFQQLENPLTRSYKGTGLGLVLTQHLARLHGGDVSFISQEGQGSQFTLLLPPSPPRLESDIDDCVFPSSTPNPIPRSSRLVLLVEAVATSINTLTEQLGRLGYWVVVARSGTEALEKARQLQPGAILLNPLLPMLSGWDVLTLLKTDAQTQPIPVLMMVTQGEKAQAFQNHADEFLKLPVQEADLQLSLTRLMQPQCRQGTSLTILHLGSDLGDVRFAALLNSDISTLNCRVLEADDLEQAEILARVWHPDVVLLDGTQLDNPFGYLQKLSRLPQLAALPLVTLDVRTTEAANQIPRLKVFPCLVLGLNLESDRHNRITALLQAIEVAAGISRRSSILLVDGAVLDNCCPIHDRLRHAKGERLSPHHLKTDEWLQALLHYLHSAGLKSAIASSWTDVCYQLDRQNIDLLLVHLGEVQPHSTLLANLKYLADLPIKPPILVLDRRGNEASSDVDMELESVLSLFECQTIGKNSTSMAALLEMANQMLNNS